MFRFVRSLTIAVAAAVTGTALIAPGMASAGAAPAISVSPTSVEVGATYTLSGVGWTCVEPVLSIDTDPVTDLGAAPDGSAQAGGAWQLDFTAPATPGTYTITAFDGECQDTATATLTVTPPPTTTTTTTTTTLAPTTTTEAPTTTLAPTTTAAVTTTSLAAAPVVLPETGTSDPATTWTALALLAGGAAMVFAARRRHT